MAFAAMSVIGPKQTWASAREDVRNDQQTITGAIEHRRVVRRTPDRDAGPSPGGGGI